MATKINKILFTSDLTKHSVKVFEQAVALALQTSASMSMIHVIKKEGSGRKIGLVDWIDEELYIRIQKKHQEKAKNVLIGKKSGISEIQKALRKYFDNNGKNMDEHQQISVDAIEVREPNAGEAIIEFAEMNGCDLIILGFHRRASFLKGLIDSGNKILEQKKINIFLVPLGE